MSNEYVPVRLDCEHTLYFKRVHHPLPGEEVYCTKCEKPAMVPQLDRNFATYYPDGEWNCYYKNARVSRGVCENCGYEFVAEFPRLRAHMEKHHRKGCAWAGDTLLFELQQIPPNSPPPF